MKKILVLLVLIGFNIVNAQKEIKFDIDHAKFYYDATSVFLELYYELQPEGISVKVDNKNDRIDAFMSIEIKKQGNDSIVLKKEWKLSQNILKEDSSDSKSLVGVLSFVMQKGEYKLLVEIRDAKNPAQKKNISENISIKPFEKNKISISEIELASGIKTSDTDPKSIFYKNTLEVTPNPRSIYSEKNPALFYYAELNNLKQKSEKSSFVLKRILTDMNGKQVLFNSKQIKQNSNSVVEYGVVNLSKIPSGTYTLSLNLIDTTTNVAYVSSKKIFVMNPKVASTNTNGSSLSGFSGSEFTIMTQEECDEMASQIKYIATDVEQTRYKKLDSLKTKQQFLYNFWLNRDNDPSTPINEFKEEYFKRVEYANSHFGLNKRLGYSTDRGRVLLLFGEPDTKDYYSSEADLKPYEIWFYNQIESGVQFIFGDPTGYGDFQLLHSTKRGEYKDENWRYRLKTQ